MIKTKLTIINKLGLHARAAAKLATTANQFASSSQLVTKDKQVDCKSVMALMLLAAAKGTDIELLCKGKDEEAAIIPLEATAISDASLVKTPWTVHAIDAWIQYLKISPSRASFLPRRRFC